jgi:hypothetical protein
MRPPRRHQVLYTFLDFFSKFDWEKYCLSIQGPVPLRLLPSLTPETPSVKGGLLLSDQFLSEMVQQYQPTVGYVALALVRNPRPSLARHSRLTLTRFSMGTSCSTTLEQAQRTLIAKHFNVMDPLLPHNNLGRSVSQSNLARIRAAFAHGAAKLRKALCCLEPTRAVAEVGSLPLQ